MTLNSPNEEKIKKRIAENLEASLPILENLKRIGFEVEWVDDLYNKHLKYKKAIPVLIYWLPRIENSAVKEAIIRALSVPWAKNTEAQNVLLNEFQNSTDEIGVKWAIGNALSIIANEEILDDIIKLIKDKKHGKAREMLVVSLGNMNSVKAESILIELLDDQDLNGYAIMALGKLKSKNALPKLIPFLASKKPWIRKVTKAAMAKINRQN